MLLSFVCVKIQWIVCCRWIRAPAEACFTVSKKHDKLDFTALGWKRTSNSYNIPSFWICSIKVDKCLRTYYKLSWKYMNTAKIISKVTITLSLIITNKDFDFVGWVIKTPCLFYFRSVKFSLWKKHMILIAFWRWWNLFDSISAQKNNQTNLCQDLLTIENTDSTWKCTRSTMQMSYSYLPFKNFCKLAKQVETMRNSARNDFGYDYSFFRKLRN